MRNFFCLVLIFSSLSLQASNKTSKEGISLSSTEFPWELVIDQGKVQGCIYDNKFYSVGSILIEETLPRKCDLNSAREGFWSELTDSELDLYEASIKEQEKIESESTSVNGIPLSFQEAGLIRYLRRMKSNKIKKNKR